MPSRVGSYQTDLGSDTIITLNVLLEASSFVRVFVTARELLREASLGSQQGILLHMHFQERRISLGNHKIHEPSKKNSIKMNEGDFQRRASKRLSEEEKQT
jgi:hypothetical protein